ncbi:MAG: Asp-tRNA(Asn)/Glu-tRNA(Gln) amidotransferase GatCAB subunit A, partial [Burkholderiales bacterium]|nr:Asp-tRNA(Asn)/Glu-tRNA(Gln) amidotransferase GatCAB subunit A [Burkholderiales bacterium]
MSSDWQDLGVAPLARALQQGQVSSVEVTQHLLTRLAAHSQLGAFLATDPELSLAQARGADARRAAGRAHALTGV